MNSHLQTNKNLKFRLLMPILQSISPSDTTPPIPDEGALPVPSSSTGGANEEENAFLGASGVRKDVDMPHCARPGNVFRP